MIIHDRLCRDIKRWEDRSDCAGLSVSAGGDLCNERSVKSSSQQLLSRIDLTRTDTHHEVDATTL